MVDVDYLELAEKCLGSQFNKERWVAFIRDEPEKAKKQILSLAGFKKIPTSAMLEEPKAKKGKK